MSSISLRGGCGVVAEDEAAEEVRQVMQCLLSLIFERDMPQCVSRSHDAMLRHRNVYGGFECNVYGGFECNVYGGSHDENLVYLCA